MNDERGKSAKDILDCFVLYNKERNYVKTFIEELAKFSKNIMKADFRKNEARHTTENYAFLVISFGETISKLS
jgi:hypothetical protein